MFPPATDVPPPEGEVHSTGCDYPHLPSLVRVYHPIPVPPLNALGSPPASAKHPTPSARPVSRNTLGSQMSGGTSLTHTCLLENLTNTRMPSLASPLSRHLPFPHLPCPSLPQPHDRSGGAHPHLIARRHLAGTSPHTWARSSMHTTRGRAGVFIREGSPEAVEGHRTASRRDFRGTRRYPDE